MLLHLLSERERVKERLSQEMLLPLLPRQHLPMQPHRTQAKGRERERERMLLARRLLIKRYV
jgi:hypothetical protein